MNDTSDLGVGVCSSTRAPPSVNDANASADGAARRHFV